MKQFYRLTTVVALLLFFVGSSWGQETITLQNFDDGTPAWLYASYPTPYSTGSDDWDIVSTNSDPSGTTGDFWGIQDIDNGNGGGSFEHTLTFSAIDISSYTSVSVEFDFYTKGFDDTDYLQYEIFQGASGSEASQGKIDLNKNTNAWTNVSISIPDINNSVYIKIIAFQNGGSDYAGLDNFKVVGTSGSIDPEPTNHPSGFTATANSSTQITTSWTDALEGDQAPTGYLVLANTTGTFSDPVDGTAQSDDTDLSDGFGVKNIGTSVETFAWTSLTASTQYFFKIFSYNGSGTSINYKTDGTVPTANATTDGLYDNDTEVYSGTQPAAKNISSLDDTQGEAEDVFVITIEDQGSGDGLPTKVTNIRVKPYTTNTADWTDAIQGVFVDDGSDFVYPTSTEITDTYIDLSFDNTQLNVNDGESVDVTLYVYLNTSVVDGQILSFMVDADAHGFTADALGSGFASPFLLGDFNSNNITINVDANKLSITQQPSDVNVDAVMSPAMVVAFTDANGNIDVDYSGDGYGINLTTTGTFAGSATIAVDATNGVSTFNNIVFSAEGSDITITANDGSGMENTSATSDAFVVSDLPNLIISEVADPSDYYRGRFIELYNADDEEINFSNTTIYLSRQANGGNWYDLQLTGSLGSKETYLIATYADFETYYGFTPEVTNSNFNGNGDDAVFIYFDGDHTTGTLMDIYGVIDEDGSGKAWEYEDSKAVRKNTISAPTSTWDSEEWNIISNCNTTSMTPGMYPVSTWNGNAAKSNVWATEGNWDNGLPSEDINVFIPTGLTNYPTISSSTTINDIKMANGATLLGQENLTVNGTATVETSITGYTTDDDGWNFISSPVSGMTIEGSDFEPVADEDDFFAYDEETNYWLDQQDAANNITSFASAIGYLAAYAPANAGTKQYVGTLNANASYSPSLSELNTKWNIVGNPYCSKLDWSSVVLANVSSAKVLSNTTGDYTDVSGDLELGQAVFVYAEGSSSVSIPLAAQTHGSGSKKDAVNYTRLNAHYGNHSLYTRFAANDNASQNYEWQLDSRYLHPLSEIPYFSAITQDEIKVSTYVCEAQAEESFIVPLYFVVQKDQEISFDFEGSMGYEIVLEDQTNGSMTELTEGLSYTFTASTTDASDRFLLHFKSTTAVEDMEALEANIYAYDGKIYISGINQMNNVRAEVLSVDGRTLYTESYHGEAVVNVPGHFVPGCYLVRLSSEKAVLTKKLIIR